MWDAILKIFQVGVQAKNAHDQKKAADALLEQQRASDRAAAEAKARNDEAQFQALTAQSTAAKMAYASLTSPGVLAAPSSGSGVLAAPSSGSGGSAFDQFLPLAIIGVIALGALSLFRR